MQVIEFRGSRADLLQKVRFLVRVLAGREHDPLGLQRELLIPVSFSLLANVRDAYVTKARGGTDAMGVSWPPLSKKYLAYGRRFGKGEQAALKRAAGLGAGHHHRGLLTAAQNKRWKAIYARCLARFLLSMPEREAKGRAAQAAWAVLKREGAKTKLEVFGNRQAEILRDTGQLLNSLTPGVWHGGGSYSPPAAKGGENQVLRVEGGSAVVGTNDPKAADHNQGRPERGLPRRQILPDDDSQIPESWREDMLDAARIAMTEIIAKGLRR
jgi:phage gpG-like protein